MYSSKTIAMRGKYKNANVAMWLTKVNPYRGRNRIEKQNGKQD